MLRRVELAWPVTDRKLRQRIIASYHLGAVSKEECGEYLEHRLRCVGWEGDPYFEPDAVDAIYDHTDGIPRKINNLCSRLMLYGFLEELHRFTRADVERVAADLDSERALNKAQEPAPANGHAQSNGHAQTNGHAAPANSLATGAVPSTAIAPVDLVAHELSEQIAELDRRLGVQEDFMRRLAVALQHAYSGR